MWLHTLKHTKKKTATVIYVTNVCWVTHIHKCKKETNNNNNKNLSFYYILIRYVKLEICKRSVFAKIYLWTEYHDHKSCLLENSTTRMPLIKPSMSENFYIQDTIIKWFISHMDEKYVYKTWFSPIRILWHLYIIKRS